MTHVATEGKVLKGRKAGQQAIYRLDEFAQRLRMAKEIAIAPPCATPQT